MDESQKKQQREQVRACSDILIETFRSAEMGEFVLMGAGRNPDGSYECWNRTNCSTAAMANMLSFLMSHIDDEACGQVIEWLLSQPHIMGKMAAAQSKRYAEAAEKLKKQQPQEAAASPDPPEAPNKSWLN